MRFHFHPSLFFPLKSSFITGTHTEHKMIVYSKDKKASTFTHMAIIRGDQREKGMEKGGRARGTPSAPSLVLVSTEKRPSNPHPSASFYG